MMEYKLDNYLDALNKQVISMDQGLCYNPEFRASKKMHDYPSRKAQIIRSIYNGELEVNEYNTEIIFKSILSRQGERWQNFRESSEDYTDSLILGRHLIVESGIMDKKIDRLLEKIEKNNGHLINIDRFNLSKHLAQLPTCEDSDYYLFLDDQTLNYLPNSLEDLTLFFKKKKMFFKNIIKSHFPGWEYFAYGLIERGKKHLKKIVSELNSENIKTVITLTGQSQYLLEKFTSKLGIKREFEVVNILELVDELETKEDVFLYGGSFYSRYLEYGDKINSLLSSGEKKSSSLENYPLYKSGPRINKVNIWEMPLTAEYELFFFPTEISEYIYKDSLNNIEKGIHNKIVIFDPYAFHELEKRNYQAEFVYFTELIETW